MREIVAIFTILRYAGEFASHLGGNGVVFQTIVAQWGLTGETLP